MKKRQSDFSQLEKVLKKQMPDRPVYFEYYVDPVVTCPDESGMNPKISDRNLARVEWDMRVFKRGNMDHACFRSTNMGFAFEMPEIHQGKTISLNEGHVLNSWADLEKYRFPKVKDADYDVLDRCKKYIPDNMGIMVDGPGGVLENTLRLVGYEDFCMMLFDDFDLAESITERIGAAIFEHYKMLTQYESVKILMINDDWGFNTQTMISPDQLRKLIIPWHKKYAELAHESGKYAVLHSCGQLTDLYEDIICDIKMDGKHSYEDNICPVEDVYEKYKGRIAILGGMDLNYLCRTDPEKIYERSKAMLECASGLGGYALGSGNSIPDYIPSSAFQAMQRALV